MRQSKSMIIPFLWLVLHELGNSHSPVGTHQAQSQCVRSVIGTSEILMSKMFDADQDGNLDEAVVYAQDDIYILLVSNASDPACRVVLNEYLTFRSLVSEQQKVDVRNIELIEVTGDNQPEIGRAS